MSSERAERDLNKVKGSLDYLISNVHDQPVLFTDSRAGDLSSVVIGETLEELREEAAKADVMYKKVQEMVGEIVENMQDHYKTIENANEEGDYDFAIQQTKLLSEQIRKYGNTVTNAKREWRRVHGRVREMERRVAAKRRARSKSPPRRRSPSPKRVVQKNKPPAKSTQLARQRPAEAMAHTESTPSAVARERLEQVHKDTMQLSIRVNTRPVLSRADLAADQSGVAINETLEELRAEAARVDVLLKECQERIRAKFEEMHKEERFAEAANQEGNYRYVIKQTGVLTNEINKHNDALHKAFEEWRRVHKLVHEMERRNRVARQSRSRSRSKSRSRSRSSSRHKSPSVKRGVRRRTKQAVKRRPAKEYPMTQTKSTLLEYAIAYDSNLDQPSKKCKVLNKTTFNFAKCIAKRYFVVSGTDGFPVPSRKSFDRLDGKFARFLTFWEDLHERVDPPKPRPNPKPKPRVRKSRSREALESWEEANLSFGSDDSTESDESTEEDESSESDESPKDSRPRSPSRRRSFSRDPSRVSPPRAFPQHIKRSSPRVSPPQESPQRIKPLSPRVSPSRESPQRIKPLSPRVSSPRESPQRIKPLSPRVSPSRSRHSRFSGSPSSSSSRSRSTTISVPRSAIKEQQPAKRARSVAKPKPRKGYGRRSVKLPATGFNGPLIKFALNYHKMADSSNRKCKQSKEDHLYDFKKFDHVQCIAKRYKEIHPSYDLNIPDDADYDQTDEKFAKFTAFWRFLSEGK